jgi:hypothetical protein
LVPVADGTTGVSLLVTLAVGGTAVLLAVAVDGRGVWVRLGVAGTAVLVGPPPPAVTVKVAAELFQVYMGLHVGPKTPIL